MPNVQTYNDYNTEQDHKMDERNTLIDTYIFL